MDLQIVQNKIFEVRGFRVILDYHLANSTKWKHEP